MVTCNLFELALTVVDGNNAVVEYFFYTDLPVGTQVILSCQRTYVDMQDETSLWVGYNERLAIQPSVFGDYAGHRGKIDVIASDQKALNLFRQINSNSSTGIKNSVGDDFTIVLTVGARQRLREFGPQNRNLSGQMVKDCGGTKCVEVSKSVRMPMNRSLQPLST